MGGQLAGHASVQIGLERCVERPPDVLRGARFGLLMNQASVDHHFRYACDVLAEAFPGSLRALFAPQHGLWGTKQANMIESPHGFHQRLQIPSYSLYSETRRPGPEMLAGLDCLLVDLQDVGTRVYTFIWTISHCLEACAEARIPVVILDRPNPLGGATVEGPLLNPDFASFVGRSAIPMRHACTLGELAAVANEQLGIGAQVEIVGMTGWHRHMLWPETGRIWLALSPNMPRWETALVYPGQVLLEGTNLSEGRGTTRPFELVGAPFIDPDLLLDELPAGCTRGVTLLPTFFEPAFDKWQGQTCGGLSWHVTDPREVRSYALTLAIIAAVRRLWPNQFRWLPPPYEYETEKQPFDILTGDARARLAIDKVQDFDLRALTELTTVDEQAWQSIVAKHRRYEKG